MKASLFVICFSLVAVISDVSAVEFSSIEFGGKRFTVCRVDIREERLQLFHRDDGGQPFKRFDRLVSWVEARNQKLVFAMNAGMFHRDFSAVGLFVSGGVEIVPLNTAKGDGNFFLKPNGVFAVTERGARVVESAEYLKLRERVVLATQSGPLLVHANKLHPACKPDSASFFIRNGVGVLSPTTVLFVISEVPVNLFEFATLFRDRLLCADALYLDGFTSSLHAPELKRSDARADLGPMIAVTQ